MPQFLPFYYLCHINPQKIMELLSYFYHPDHLGSSSWITDNTGRPIQHLHYLPFGEDWVDQRNSTWNAPYTFSGKEKDVETGYGYFGARYYDSGLSIWLSVDPMSDKYSNMSPYNYCANNPVILVDPDGRTPWPAILYGAGVIMENVIPDYHVRQIGYAIQHPINALTVIADIPGRTNYNEIASNFQVNICKKAGLTWKKEGDQGNAYRHTLWQAILTNELGNSQAERIGNSHEHNPNADLTQRKFSNLLLADQVVDLKNNQIGRKIGREHKGASNQELALLTLDQFYNDGLWTTVTNKDKTVSIVKTRITKEQYEAARSEILRKNENGMDK